MLYILGSFFEKKNSIWISFSGKKLLRKNLFCKPNSYESKIEISDQFNIYLIIFGEKIFKKIYGDLQSVLKRRPDKMSCKKHKQLAYFYWKSTSRHWLKWMELCINNVGH